MSSRFLVPDPQHPVARADGPPTFSVIIAAYQAAATIAEAVESALGQTVPPLEVVVCDDGSTDGTGAALTPYEDRIVYVRKENSGEASAKNAAAQAASGDYVVILDADDIFAPKRLEALGELATLRPDLDILTTDAYLEFDGRVIKRCYEGGMRFVVNDQRSGILEQNFVFGHAAVRRQSWLAVGGFDPEIVGTTDWDCWIRMIIGGSRVGLVDEPLAYYRLHGASLTAQRASLIRNRIATLEKTSRHPSLSDGERRVVAGAITRQHRLLALADARAALIQRRPDARRRSFAVALQRGVGLRTRLKALASALAPGLAARLLARAPQELAGGVFVRR